jgi:hypothetical protein
MANQQEMPDPNQREWKPRWTVITSPPGMAERWAVRSMNSRRQGGVALLLLGLVYFGMAAMRAWSNGDNGSLFTDSMLCVLMAVAAWDRYAFGLLVERYDAELRDLQTPRHPA